MSKLLLLLALASAGSVAQVQTVSGDRIRAHVKFLASDLMEGRGVGTRGGQLATEYLATQFELAGLQPAGDNGTFFQKVPLVGIEAQPDSKLQITGSGNPVTLEWIRDFVGANLRQKPADQFEADAIFVGHGITAPEFKWDDFKGVDVRGKVLVLFTNEPDSTDPAFFGGRALTYYGRWTYKFEEALRRGALGAIIIHTTPTAGYGWDVVKNSWGREEPFVRLRAGEPAMAFSGWVTSEAGEKFLAPSGRTIKQLLEESNSRGFKPVPLSIRVSGSITSKIRELDTRNVAGMVPGSDPALKNEVAIFSAHWDHLGIGTPVNGDAIYNGAMDNATGCGMLIEVARAWSAMQPKAKRSALFLAVTAEEGGLRGSEFYAEHPTIPAGKTAVALNFDGFQPLGRTRDVSLTGAERTTLYPIVQAVAKKFELAIKPEAHPEQGHFYRSDHFPFAKAGIPAFSINLGSDFVGKPAGFGEKTFQEFNEKHYHQPSDEYRDEWDFSGLEQMARFGMQVGIEAANLDGLPTWKKGDEFLPAREKSGVR